MFMSCADLKNALETAAKITEAYKELNIHMSVNDPVQSARDILVAYTMLSNETTNKQTKQFCWNKVLVGYLVFYSMERDN